MMPTKNIIDTSSGAGIILTETPISLSDEKLKSMMYRTYESAERKEKEFHIYKLYGIFLSIAGTLFLSLLTSSFKAIGGLSAEAVTHIAVGICGCSGLAGIIFACVAYTKNTNGDTRNRDVAVNALFEEHFHS